MLRTHHCYTHPEDGDVRIDSGDYMVNGRLSNFWYWTVIETGECKHGYGGPWPDVSDQYVTITVPKVWLEERSPYV